MADVSTIRALDAIKALAFIGDLSMGQPTDHSLRTSWLAARLAAEAGHDDTQCCVVQEVSLLRWSGCTANAAGFSEWLGDDIGSREAMLAMRPGWGGEAEAEGRLAGSPLRGAPRLRPRRPSRSRRSTARYRGKSPVCSVSKT
jgi:hypothetical protein